MAGFAQQGAAPEESPSGTCTCPMMQGAAGEGSDMRCMDGAANADAAGMGCMQGKAGSEGARGRMGDRMGGRMGGGMAGGRVMHSAMNLVHNRYSITREVEEIEGGVRTLTRVATTDPALREVLLTHVRQVSDLIASGGRVRAWDPLFAEIFDHYDEIEMQIEELDDGVRVTETSTNPEVTKLIRAHAAKVNDFLARGHAAVHEATPLPDGYVDR